MSNGLYPDKNRRSVGTELGQNYLQMLAVDKERVGNLEGIILQKRLNTNERCKSHHKMMLNIRTILT